ncbi:MULTISPECIES: FAD-dependent oxidoreductase [Bartonella]|uniref:D-amino-acid oxidase n=1 Tax=Bartonella choladocola TaxID=2750995 RepID=A0A1U9MG81_9HYPH|nr:MULTISPECIES: FAD-dependent oxidoreductase [Bartonella]AQT46914.1 glycine oxidase [Bartonella choladocola]MBH9974077.1 FAD-dependent oxidoreductase [Bartonella choladocola]MBI0013684.1 FAD-dependent oxidoreductase [Bartonella sp. B10834G3]MBI0140270.1 FAD-dependent oxidoreductase [Bartonella choladocola]
MQKVKKKILVKGCGVAGLTSAYMLAKAGAEITISAPADSPRGAASWYAGGMLAPYCERESAEARVETLGLQTMKWWSETLPDLVTHKGTLVVAPPRDSAELERFSRRTGGHRKIGADEIAKLEPDLAGRFSRGLFYETEAHIDPRKALLALKQKLKDMGATFVDIDADEAGFDFIVDATGFARIDQDHDMRGVRGEMLLVHNGDISFSRPIRLVHPRIPLYIVPRDNGIFMIGATMIESDDNRPITAHSMMDFLNAAYTIHPSFGEAEIVEIGVGVRPAYKDNFPRVKQEDNHIYVNGMHRHGYLISPEMARQVTEIVMG